MLVEFVILLNGLGIGLLFGYLSFAGQYLVAAELQKGIDTLGKLLHCECLLVLNRYSQNTP